MKKSLTLCALLLVATHIHAQLADGSIAPDFTATDLQGNTWHLYDVLNQGKSVILDVSATWCNPCWQYHKSGELESLYEAYGPSGTNELMVFMIEGDALTGINDLYGLTTGTQGNWVEGTPYPIMDFAPINNLYQINYFPTLYVICPDKLLRLADQAPASTIYALTSACPAPVGQNNASILKYEGYSGDFCSNVHFPPAIYLQNMGHDTLRSAEITFLLSGSLQQTIHWTGALPSYATELVAFDSVTIQNNAQIAIQINKVNGLDDDNPVDNTVVVPVTVAPSTDQADILLDLKLDNSPSEIYWEITDDAGHLLYFGGNKAAKYPGESNEDRYLSANTLLSFNLPLPASRCYNFSIYDFIGDGLQGFGYYKVRTKSGEVLCQGSTFTYQQTRPFGLNGSTGTSSNASLTFMPPLPADFCKAYRFPPKVKLQNNGNNPITTVKFNVSGNNTDYLTYTWNGNLQPYGAATITMDSITLTSTDNVKVTILEVNGSPDTLSYKNSLSRSTVRRRTTVSNWIVDVTTDTHGYETYWQIADNSGQVLYSGGNTLVGPSGGGLGIAMPGDPGAYDNNYHTIVQAPIPSAGCYQLIVTDDGGDGMNLFGFGQPTPFVRVRNPQVGIIAGVNGNFGANFISNIELAGASTSSEEASVPLLFAPNPAGNYCSVLFDNNGSFGGQLTLWNAWGEKVGFFNLEKGLARFDIPVASLPAGVYFAQLSGEKQRGGGVLVVER